MKESSKTQCSMGKVRSLTLTLEMFMRVNSMSIIKMDNAPSLLKMVSNTLGILNLTWKVLRAVTMERENDCT